MFVKSVMIPKEKCLTIKGNASVLDALNELEAKDIDALPIIEDGKYKGMFNKYLLYKAFFYSNTDKDTFLKQTKVSDVVTREDTFVQTSDVFEQAFMKLYDFPILAVVEDEKFLGIVTRYDTIHQFKSAFGMNTKGTRIAFTSVESEGRILKMSDILHKYHTSVISLVTFDETDKLVRRIVLKIDNEQKLDRIIQDLEKSGFRVLHIDKDE
ncbi:MULTISPECIES: CBS domain-containing protein [Psychrobacillus]|uniref:CBS domain-containing protein n=1 Tax=Psychrobacillus faecigallinarum TaxID=2762235 RepID=A0ABR8RBK4_9BACI|nr:MULTISPECIES: CBS domain-containing protein [Psychrobacillus]MBD7945167.1 CBS domain-containing protein [Psychrobacillus faecigallinarum]QEY19882.1 CBS domain-containing protein [Psychrobacillus sp. AK 1817]QGM30422.1 CBS domain-containing protein [Bacillus sp. N3536]